MNWIPRGLRVAGKVDEIRQPDLDEFDALLKAGRPALIRGENSGTTAVKDWSPGYLRDRCGDVPVRVFVSLAGNFSVDIDSSSATRKEVADMTLGEFLGRVSGDSAYPALLGPGEVYYLYAFPAQAFEAVAADLPKPRFIAGGRYGAVRSNFWISQPGYVTPAHADPFHDNLLAQILGTKRMLIWDPSQAQLLYMRPFGDRHAGQLQADLQAPCYDRFPRLPEASALEVCLHPGDILYLPEAWVHYVYVETLSISVNYWFCLRQDFQKALAEVSRQFNNLRPELKGFYVYMLQLSDSVINSF